MQRQTTETPRTQRTKGSERGKRRRAVRGSARLDGTSPHAAPAAKRPRRALPLLLTLLLCALCVSVVRLFLPARTAPGPVGEETRLGQAVQRAPRAWAAHQALGRYYLDHGQAVEAIWELGAAQRLQPGAL